MLNENTAVEKIIGMFRPYDGENFLDYDGALTICGPNDRAMMGYDTNFPVQWLIEDFDFTREEAVWFLDRVNKHHGLNREFILEEADTN